MASGAAYAARMPTGGSRADGVSLWMSAALPRCEDERATSGLSSSIDTIIAILFAVIQSPTNITNRAPTG